MARSTVDGHRVPLGRRVLMKGNEALAEAALKAGCRAFFGYPITPASEISSYMARHMHDAGGVFLQPESEVAAASMVFGAAAGGVRAMTASSSPGISLMSEGVSYLCAAELPCLIVNMMRVGPGLGGIQPSQADYLQATRGLGHGGARAIVLAPSSVQEVVDLVFEGFALAEHYRIPVMLLADGVIGQMMEPVTFSREIDPRKLPVPPWATTGAAGRPRRLVKTLYLDPVALERHNSVLREKQRAIDGREARSVVRPSQGARVLVVAYGTAARVSRHAADLAAERRVPIALFRPVTLYPFPHHALRMAVEEQGIARVLVVELSDGQLVEDVRLALEGRCPVELFGASGGTVPAPLEILTTMLRLEQTADTLQGARP